MNTPFHRPASSWTLDRRKLLKFAGGGLAAAAVGSAAGCGSGGGDNPDNVPTVDLSKQVNLGQPEGGIFYPEPYLGPRAYERAPFGDGTQTFKVVVPQNPIVVGDWNKNKFSAWLEKRTGIKVEYVAVNTTGPDGSTDLSKINAMIASGDLPDAFLTVGLTGDQIALYGQQGLFTDVTDLVEVYAPVQRQMLADDPSLRQTSSALDGRRYRMVGVNDCYHCRSRMSKAFINEEYLQKIGAAMPETIEDFRNVLKEMKERNPSGKDGFVPFLGWSPANDPMDVWFVNPFTYNPGTSLPGEPGAPWLRLNAGKVEFVPTMPQWREAMAYMRSLYDDGTLTKQSFTMTAPEMVKLGDAGLIGCARAFYWGPFVSIEYQPGALWEKYVPVMPLIGPTGQRVTSTTYYRQPHGNFVISRKAQNPELLVQWGDYQMDLEATMRCYDRGGDPGQGWRYAKDGEKGIDDRQAVWSSIEQPEDAETVGSGWDQLGLMYRSLDFRNGEVNDPKNPTIENRLYQVSVEYEKFAQPKEMELPPLIFEEADAAIVADVKSSLEDHVRGSMARFATAGADINDDAVWNAYVAEAEKMNLNQLIETYQRAYDNRPQ